MRDFFVLGPAIPQIGETIPELGETLTVRVISESTVSANVVVRFLIQGIEVRRAELLIAPFETSIDIGPDLAAVLEVTGTYSTGASTPPLVLIVGTGFKGGDTKEYVIPDPSDGCPTDRDKLSSGVCGCGVADVDTDGDGTLDCVDGCPSDPAKIAAGACGCGTADADSDGDGTMDCVDDCPLDAAKTAPGECGCGKIDRPNCVPPAPPPPGPGPIQPICGDTPDIDDDGDVDGVDFGYFAYCFNGTGNPPPHGDCTVADFTCDGSVDSVDYDIFRACFNGTGNPPACPSQEGV